MNDKKYLDNPIIDTEVELRRIISDGIPFTKTVKISATAADVAIDILPKSLVEQIGEGLKVFIDNFRLVVNGSTAWSGGTLTKLTIKDSGGKDMIDVAIAALTGNALLVPGSADVTELDPYLLNEGTDAGEGIQIVGDNAAGAGDDVYVSITGRIQRFPDE